MARKKGEKFGPYKPIDYEKVRKMARTMALQTEMARMCGVAYSTWKKRRNEDPKIEEAIEQGRAEGCFSLRAAQMKQALAGNTQMLKWCGMQYLGQKHAMQHANDPDHPLPAAAPTQVFNFADAEEAAAAFDNYIRTGKLKKK